MKFTKLQERLIKFSVSILNLSERFPSHYSGKYFSQQLIRSGTSPALNYAEALSAESKADFIHKMKICLKELRETQVNLQIVFEKNYVKEMNLDIMNECSELVAIFTSSIKTLKKERGK